TGGRCCGCSTRPARRPCERPCPEGGTRAELRFPARPPQAACPAFARKRAPTGPLPRPCGSALGRECLLAQVCSFCLVGATLVVSAFGHGWPPLPLWERPCRECFRAQARSHGQGRSLAPVGATLVANAFGRRRAPFVLVGSTLSRVLSRASAL